MAVLKSLFNTYIPAVLWWLVVLVLMCTPGQDLPKLGSWADLISLDKLIHVFIFGVMTYLFMRPVAADSLSGGEKKRTFLKIAICVMIWGLTTEFIQKFWIPNRSFDLYDFVADSIGALLAFALHRKVFATR